MENQEKLSTKKDLKSMFTKGQIETAKLFGCKPSQVADSQDDLQDCEYFFGTLVIRGENNNIDAFKNLKGINGSLIMLDCNFEWLDNLKMITDSASFVNCKIKYFNSLEHVGQTLYLQGSEVLAFPHLNHVGCVDMNNSKVLSFNNLSSVEFNVFMKNSYVGKAQKIKVVGRDCVLENSSVDCLPNQHIDCQNIINIEKKGGKITTHKNGYTPNQQPEK